MVGESLPSGTRIDLTFIYFFHKENSIHNFCLSGSIYEFLHFHALFQLIDNNDYYISHGHFAHVAYAWNVVFQIFDRMIFGEWLPDAERIRGDSTRTPGATRSDKVWEPLISSMSYLL